MTKSKNLFSLPSVIATFVVLGYSPINAAIDDIFLNRFNPKAYKDLIGAVLLASSTAFLRYAEDDDVHTPNGLPGRNSPAIEKIETIQEVDDIDLSGFY
jgi:hypothetical protein